MLIGGGPGGGGEGGNNHTAQYIIGLGGCMIPEALDEAMTNAKQMGKVLYRRISFMGMLANVNPKL